MSTTTSPRIAVVKTITPTRIGMGQASGLIDLPVIREVTTGWPVLPGSSIKGVLKDRCKRELVAGGKSAEEADRELAPLFGGEDNAGSIVATDLSVLLFPVRSVYGVYALTTCPLALRRLRRLIALRRPEESISIPDIPNEFPTEDSQLPFAVHSRSAVVVRNSEARIEDLDLAARPDDQVTLLAESLKTLVGEDIVQRLLVLDDSVFTYMTRSATEQRTRTALDFDTKTAKGKHLRTEEYLPIETFFVGYYELPEDYWTIPKLQIGGYASVGAGIVEWRTV